jgi:hypothetical protein
MAALSHDGVGPPPSARPPGKPLVFKEHWTAALSDQLRLFTVQLVCSGGSSAIAKTVVAPLERIKVCSVEAHVHGRAHGRSWPPLRVACTYNHAW